MRQLGIVISMLLAFAAAAQQDQTGSISYSPSVITGPIIRQIQLSTGVEIEYAEQGKPSGIPVILLHGISDSWHSFETTLPWLQP
ncbi:MAG: alpha/beta fold hydrolase, partial [Flavisolibacter sp.]